MAEQQWWESLAIGDKALLKDVYQTTLVRLLRRTPTQMIFHVKGGPCWRFLRRSGEEIGRTRWTYLRLEPYTDEAHAEFILGEYRRRLKTWCANATLATFTDLDRTQCEALWQVLMTLGLVRKEMPDA